MSKVLVMTKEAWLELNEYHDWFRVADVRSAMTEVDLDEILGEWINGVVADGGKPFSSCVLARIKEGK